MRIYFLVTLVAFLALSQTYQLSMFYCGFSGDYCGQSNTDDVNPKASIIILAFLNTSPDGSAIVDSNNFPTDLVKKWKSQGKIVVLSVGGQNGNWATVFANQGNTNRFINSLLNHVRNFGVDGVDLDIQSYFATPRSVANMIIQLKTQLMKTGKKYVIVSPEDVTVYQGTAVPNPDQPGQPFNYFVPIIQLADNYIDFYQPQAYNNWYDGLPGGSLDYLKDVYLNWRNFQGMSPWAGPIPKFSGVSGSKLLIGILASSQAGGAAYYAPPGVILSFKSFLTQFKYQLKGFMMWDSHWDALNGYQVSNACTS